MEKTHTIDEWMRIKGLSRERVADLCGVTTMTVTNWQKKDASRMPIGNALKLAQIFDVPITSISFLPKN